MGTAASARVSRGGRTCGRAPAEAPEERSARSTANLCTSTKILDFRGFDSSRILSSRGGILMSTWNFPESLHQAIFVGTGITRQACA